MQCRTSPCEVVRIQGLVNSGIVGALWLKIVYRSVTIEYQRLNLVKVGADSPLVTHPHFSSKTIASYTLPRVQTSLGLPRNGFHVWLV